MDQREEQTIDNNTTYMFHGSHTRSVDGKGRFNLPFQFRRSGGVQENERYVVADGPDGTLNLLPYSEWIIAFNRMRQRDPNRSLRDELRRMSHNSRLVEPDAQGRIAVSPDILKKTGIVKKVLVMGMGNYLEMWDPERFEQYQAGLGDADTEFLNDFYR